jgi:Putative beta-barrel porin-2, OmpL-like. bbp2
MFATSDKKMGVVMKRLFLLGIIVLAIAASGRAIAADAFGAFSNGLPTAWVEGPTCDPYVDYNCSPSKATMALKSGLNGPCDPYVNYKCLDAYLGDNPAIRFLRYYQLEWGKAVAPGDPSAPPGRRSDAAWPPTPQSSPPMPFTEWPYGGTENIGVTRPNSVDSPLMVAIANTGAGKLLSDSHIQIYGWVEGGGNVSSNKVQPGGNAPAAYDYTPNSIQLDQAVVYVERLADTVQNDHIDWGFRFSTLYGVDYRYTTAYGLMSYQLLNHNLVNGIDFPMVYADIYFPVLQGMDVRIGRFISIPDIEAQLAPNNYTYVHSLTYTFDNYTNTGVEVTTALTKNWILQLGVTVGSDTMPWNVGQTVTNLLPGNPLYPSATIPKDPGAVPSATVGIRWTSDDGRDDVNIVGDALNGGQWGYNNLQWIGGTYYHKINDYWHIAFETWNIHENNVPNVSNPAVAAIIAGGGTPFGPNVMPFNAPNAAQCGNTTALACRADEQAFLLYVNYSPNKLNNFSIRTEWFDDHNGQRTGVATRYVDVAFSWQHWFSPQIEARPEVAYYKSLDAAAFNGNTNAGIAPNRDYALIGAADLIIHF